MLQQEYSSGGHGVPELNCQILLGEKATARTERIWPSSVFFSSNALRQQRVEMENPVDRDANILQWAFAADGLKWPPVALARYGLLLWQYLGAKSVSRLGP